MADVYVTYLLTYVTCAVKKESVMFDVHMFDEKNTPRPLFFFTMQVALYRGRLHKDPESAVSLYGSSVPGPFQPLLEG